MSLAKEFKKCPHCKETIAKGATRCKHCQADLPPVKKRWAWFRKHDKFRTGFLAGIAFSLILTLLTYLHYYSGE